MRKITEILQNGKSFILKIAERMRFAEQKTLLERLEAEIKKNDNLKKVQLDGVDFVAFPSSNGVHTKSSMAKLIKAR